MIQSLQVLSTVKDHRLKLNESITHLGGLNADGTPWQLSVTEAIAGIRARTWEFYVVDQAGRKVWLHVTVSREGHEYLKTLRDPEVPYMLLALPSEIDGG